MNVCVCVCVCVWEREREWSILKTSIHSHSLWIKLPKDNSLLFLNIVKEKPENSGNGNAFLKTSGQDVPLSKELIMERMDLFNPDWKEENKTSVFPVISDPKYKGPFGLKVIIWYDLAI